jgi:hypothetical protein
MNQTPPPPYEPPPPNQQTYQQYQPPPYYPPPYYYPPPVVNPGNGFAIASLVLGIVGITMGWGLVEGIIGLIMANLSNKKQAEVGLPPIGYAKAGKITSIIGIVIGSLIVFAYVAYFGLFFALFTYQ